VEKESATESVQALVDAAIAENLARSGEESPGEVAKRKCSSQSREAYQVVDTMRGSS
jgi:hypothetical protein